MSPSITHEESDRKGAFLLGERAKMTYRRPEADVMDVDHTFTDPAHRGQGLAHELYHEMVRFARAEDRKVVPTCPFVATMFERNPEDADVLK